VWLWLLFALSLRCTTGFFSLKSSAGLSSSCWICAVEPVLQLLAEVGLVALLGCFLGNNSSLGSAKSGNGCSKSCADDAHNTNIGKPLGVP